MVALRMILRDADILVHVESLHILEADLTPFVRLGNRIDRNVKVTINISVMYEQSQKPPS